jgi:hypothetical protein
LWKYSAEFVLVPRSVINAARYKFSRVMRWGKIIGSAKLQLIYKLRNQNSENHWKLFPLLSFSLYKAEKISLVLFWYDDLVL